MLNPHLDKNINTATAIFLWPGEPLCTRRDNRLVGSHSLGERIISPLPLQLNLLRGCCRPITHRTGVLRIARCLARGASMQLRRPFKRASV